MPINIFGPSPTGPVGPGIQSVTQAIIDPYPAQFHWEVAVVDLVLSGDQQLLRHSFPVLSEPSGPPSFTLGDRTAGTLSFPSFQSLTVQGDSVNYRVRLINQSTGAVVAEAVQGQIWDASYAFRLSATATGTGGFTQSDRDDLTIVKASVYTPLGGVLASGLQPILQLVDLVRGPSRATLRPGSTRLLTGRGVLTPLVDENGSRAFGGTWSWFTVPAGFGFADGQLAEYFNRMAQFLVLREGSDNGLYLDEVSDSNAEGGFLLWKLPFPTQVSYDIAPGVTVAWRWLI